MVILRKEREMIRVLEGKKKKAIVGGRDLGKVMVIALDRNL